MYLVILILLFIAPSVTFATNVVDLGQLPLAVVSLNAPPANIDLGQDLRRGVEARAYLEPQPLLDLSEPLAENLQHVLISVVFVDKATGQELIDGLVAARTSTDINRKTNTVRLEPQKNQWTGNLIVPTEGETMIKIGSKLGDGKKRIYRFFLDQRPIPSMLEDVPPVE